MEERINKLADRKIEMIQVEEDRQLNLKKRRNSTKILKNI